MIRHLLFWALLLKLLTQVSPVAAQTLDEELRRMPAAELAGLARTEGDAVRGAVVFFQHQMGCSKCHSAGDRKQSALGPDVAALGKEMGDETLVESVLLFVTAVTGVIDNTIHELADRIPRLWSPQHSDPKCFARITREDERGLKLNRERRPVAE